MKTQYSNLKENFENSVKWLKRNLGILEDDIQFLEIATGSADRFTTISYIIQIPNKRISTKKIKEFNKKFNAEYFECGKIYYYI